MLIDLKTRSHCSATKNFNEIFPSLSVVMQWFLDPVATAMAMEKMGIMATTTTEIEVFVAVAATVVNEP